ncbi:MULTISPECIES: AMP-binding protein [Nocardiaceae]|uniref:Fatty-acyl-CoA synthase n=1 Tax=Rhodococcoides corynebacterioides TaxID=53972 RepID=A0ABS2KU82_9NOCA|nr:MULTISPECIES: AMP-binding protein [Rhodococcus]MBM7415494.1 fatty-acyl-CoA synthase [Rhodococcus corynebacterioides]MBP1117956.1 fatty-acyl-CoA synthase [Rhodococcus sp. PvP016]
MTSVPGGPPEGSAVADDGSSASWCVGSSDTPLLDTTIGADLDATTERFGERDALVESATGRRWNYTEFHREVVTLAAAFLARGVTAGDRVAIWAPNCAEWTMVQYATAKIGAILVNVNPAYRSHELRYLLQQSGSRLLITVPKFKSSDYAAMIEEVVADCPLLASSIFIGTDSWTALLADARLVDRSAVAAAQNLTRADDPINIQYTSGTTGSPKGATLSHRNILNNGFFVGELLGYTEADRVCIPVPFYHCFGMVIGNLACTTHGSAMVIPGPSFEPVETLRAVEEARCTSLYGVPTMFIAELEHPDFDSFDLSSLRTGVMAGSPCPVDVMKQVLDRMGMTEVGICYGMTETSPVSLQTRPDDSVEKRVSTVGRVGPHLEVKIIDTVTGEVVRRGAPGELCTRGYSVMLGYWQSPEMTRDAIDGEGWMHTGDLAVMDGDGYVVITGRIKDMVIRGGENIYPREVEEFLFSHPDIIDAQVIGVPDEKYGEELVACLRLRTGARDLTADEVREFCRGKLAHYKVPRYVHVMDSFPMTVTGKVRKIELREQVRMHSAGRRG